MIGDLRHLEYARCGKINVLKNNFVDMIRNNYAGLFQKGLLSDQLVERFGSDGIPSDSTIICLNNSYAMQIAGLNEQVLSEKSKLHGWTENQKNVAKTILRENLFDNNEVLAALNKVNSRFDELNEHWTSNALDRWELTSVGIAIAHSYVSASAEFSDLSIWL